MSITAKACVGARDHRPRYFEVDQHHIRPHYLADLLGVPRPRETVPLCSGCHDAAHHLIHHLVNDGTVDDHHAAPRVAALARTAYRWWTDGVLASHGGPR